MAGKKLNWLSDEHEGCFKVRKSPKTWMTIKNYDIIKKTCSFKGYYSNSGYMKTSLMKKFHRLRLWLGVALKVMNFL